MQLSQRAKEQERVDLTASIFTDTSQQIQSNKAEATSGTILFGLQKRGFSVTPSTDISELEERLGTRRFTLSRTGQEATLAISRQQKQLQILLTFASDSDAKQVLQAIPQVTGMGNELVDAISQPIPLRAGSERAKITHASYMRTVEYITSGTYLNHSDGSL